MERRLEFSVNPQVFSHSAGPDGSDEETILPNAVELARHLTGARIAWLMLPGEGTSPLQFVAVSQDHAPEQGVAPVKASAAGRLQPGATRLADADDVVLPPILPFSRKVPARPVQTALSTTVDAGGKSTGMLIVAEPLSPAGFDRDAPTLLEMLAASVTHYLTMAATQRRMSQAPRLLQRQAIDAVEDERRRIARDLHDELGHALSAAILRIDLAAMTLSVDVAQSRDSIERARTSLVECAEALHSIVFHLRPPILDDLGLAAALKRLVAQANEVKGTRIALTLEERVRPLPEGLDLVVFRIVQEALTNIRKHARATEARVRLRYTARWLLLRVEDNGVGVHSHIEPERKGTGLAGMRERVGLYGGELRLELREQGGAALVARLPLPAAQGGM